MKILTVGESPYLLSKSGKMHADVISELKKKGHQIDSAVWNFDITWFSVNDEGKYFYEDERDEICELHPFNPHPDKTPGFLFELLKKTESEIIVSLTEHDDTVVSALFAVCGLSPGKIKWFGIFLVEALPLNEKFVEVFNVVNSSILTTKSAYDAVKKINQEIDCYYVPYGPDHTKFFDQEKNRKGIISCSKNAQVSNIGALLLAMKSTDTNLYLNTNHSDVGEYDLEVLMRRYKLENVSLPDRFVSLNDGLTCEELNEEYNKSDIIIDASVRSSTALSVKEGMAAGCIPITTRVGALEEVMEKLPEEYQFFVKSIMYIGDHEKEYQIISVDDLVKQIEKVRKIKCENREEFEKIRRKVKETALLFENITISEKIVELIEEKKRNYRTIGVDII